MTTHATHDSYIASAPEKFRTLLYDPRAQLLRALPDATEVIKYDTPGYQINETIIDGYVAFSKQCGLYVDPTAIRTFKTKLEALNLKPTKTGVTFPASKPLPAALVEKLAKASQSAKGL